MRRRLAPSPRARGGWIADRVAVDKEGAGPDPAKRQPLPQEGLAGGPLGDDGRCDTAYLAGLKAVRSLPGTSSEGRCSCWQSSFPLLRPKLWD